MDEKTSCITLYNYYAFYDRKVKMKNYINLSLLTVLFYNMSKLLIL